MLPNRRFFSSRKDYLEIYYKYFLKVLNLNNVKWIKKELKEFITSFHFY